MTSTCVTEKPVLVTGATGWLASHTIYLLLEKGYRVRGTVRDLKSSKAEFLKTFHPKAATHLEICEANLLKAEGWDEAVDGCEFVLHTASPFTFSYRNEEKDLLQPAVEGVDNVFNACIRKSVKRIVQTSSVCAVTYGHTEERYRSTRKLVDEAINARLEELRRPLSSDDSQETIDSSSNEIEKVAGCQAPVRTSKPTGTHLGDFKLFDETEFSVLSQVIGYELSKTKAELRAWEIVNAHNQTVEDPTNKLELVVMCPGFIFGPIFCADQAKGESSSHILRIILKTYPFVPDINSAHADVRDVAACHVLGLEGASEKVAGERFLVCADDGNISFAEQGRIIAKKFKSFGFSPASTVAPHWITRVGGRIFPSVKAAANKLHCVCYVSNDKAHARLGMTHWRRTDEALISHCLSLMKFGVIHPRKTPQELIDHCEAYCTSAA